MDNVFEEMHNNHENCRIINDNDIMQVKLRPSEIKNSFIC